MFHRIEELSLFVTNIKYILYIDNSRQYFVACIQPSIPLGVKDSGHGGLYN